MKDKFAELHKAVQNTINDHYCDTPDMIAFFVMELVKCYTETKVVDADGGFVKVGDTLYSVIDGGEVVVENLRRGTDFYSSAIEASDESATGWADARYYTHTPPVLDADGVEIKVGDTVWLGSDELIVTEIDENGRVTGDYPEFHCAKPVVGVGGIPPSDLTHTPPDSLERIIEDMAKQIADWHDFHGRPNGAMQKYERIRDRLCELKARGK